MDNLFQDTVCNIRTVLVLSRRLSSAGQSLCLQISVLWLVILSRSCLVPLMELMMILFMKLMGHMLRSLLFFSLVGALLMIFRTCVLLWCLLLLFFLLVSVVDGTLVFLLEVWLNLQIRLNSVMLDSAFTEVNDSTLVRSLVWWSDARQTKLMWDVAANHFYHLKSNTKYDYWTRTFN